MVASISNLLVENDYDVTVIYSKRDETPEWLNDYFHESVKLVRLDMSPLSNAPLIAIRLRRLIRQFDPDIVHLHSSVAGFIGRVAVSRIKSIKVFYSPHCISFMMTNLPAYKRYGYILLERIANKFSGEYVACSESERQAITKNIKHATVHKIDNAVENDMGDTKTAKIFSRDVIKIITVGQIRRQKNPDLYAAIAQNITAKNNNVEFIWAGDGEPGFKNTLLSAGVNVTGWLTKSEIINLLSESDLYLSTSDWEGLPVSILEAMQIGLPLIVSNCSGNIDLVENKVNGLIFKDAEEGIEMIEQCLVDRELCLTLSRNSLKLATERFSMTTFNNKYLELYQTAI